jgi:uncharacterized protein YbaR (Trm112 family)
MTDEPSIDNRQSTIDNPRMRQDLMEILVCPLCKGDLQLTVDREEGDEIVDGKLVCSQCQETYPIEDGIPNLLPPDLRG